MIMEGTEFLKEIKEEGTPCFARRERNGSSRAYKGSCRLASPLQNPHGTLGFRPTLYLGVSQHLQAPILESFQQISVEKTCDHGTIRCKDFNPLGSRCSPI
ncbi:hypothetical protein SUGI_0269610 [Cryptomeria japonica]|nr:hypothetical protein SUGI_0269610 [Cryptomeria japonica]